jgi:hypothetical protein
MRELPMPDGSDAQTPFAPIAMCSNRPVLRKLLVGSWAQLGRDPPELQGSIEGGQQRNWRGSRRPRRWQDVWQIAVHFSIPERLLVDCSSSITEGREACPSYPCTTVFTKHHAPCRLQGLKILIGLEEGPDGQGIENPKCDHEE